MYKIKKIFQSTIARITSIALVIAIILSGFFYYNFYLDQYHKLKGYWWIYKGDKALKKENLQEAIKCYEIGIKLNPAHYKAMYNLANIYVIYEDYYSALKNYEKALLVNPSFETARIDYAIILSENYKTDKAIEEYKKIIEDKNDTINLPLIKLRKKTSTYNRGIAYYNLGLAYRTKSLSAGLNKKTSKEYLKKAGESYEQAALILNSYNANYNLGLINQLLKNQYQSGHYYCKAIEVSPLEYEAHFNLAVLLNDMKDYKNAREEFKKAGLLVGSKGDPAKIRYIYDTLNQVNQKIAVNYDEKALKELREEQDKNLQFTYKAGKVVYNKNDEKAESAFLENFKNCANKEFFLGEKK